MCFGLLYVLEILREREARDGGKVLEVVVVLFICVCA